MNERDLARINGIGRAILGAGLVLAPGVAARSWIGDEASANGAKVVARALGIRDVALGTGLLLALNNGDPARNWIAGAAAADAIDAAATLIGWNELPRAGRLGVLALAAGSALQMGVLARTLR